MAAACASCAASTSTSTWNVSPPGAPARSARPASFIPRVAAALIASAVTSGGRQTAAYLLTQSLTATAGTPGAYPSAGVRTGLIVAGDQHDGNAVLGGHKGIEQPFAGPRAVYPDRGNGVGK